MDRQPSPWAAALIVLAAFTSHRATAQTLRTPVRVPIVHALTSSRQADAAPPVPGPPSDVSGDAHITVNADSKIVPEGGWISGVHYSTLKDGAAAGTTSVVLVFSYTCKGCYMFEDYLDHWLQTRAGHVSVLRVPVQWDSQNRAHARLHYTLEVLGRSDLFRRVFEAVQVKHIPLYSDDAAANFSRQSAFAVANGVDANAFAVAYHSKQVEDQLSRAKDLQVRYQIQGTPSLAIDETYVTDAIRMCYDVPTSDVIFRRMLNLTSLLIERDQERLATKPNQPEKGLAHSGAKS
jgi:hypothetical protein